MKIIKFGMVFYSGKGGKKAGKAVVQTYKKMEGRFG